MIFFLRAFVCVIVFVRERSRRREGGGERVERREEGRDVAAVMK